MTALKDEKYDIRVSSVLIAFCFKHLNKRLVSGLVITVMPYFSYGPEFFCFDATLDPFANVFTSETVMKQLPTQNIC